MYGFAVLYSISISLGNNVGGVLFSKLSKYILIILLILLNADLWFISLFNAGSPAKTSSRVIFIFSIYSTFPVLVLMKRFFLAFHVH